jgi:hypothetical protein
MRPTNPYEQLYVKLQFERSGLFKLVRKLLPIRSVFYPCCAYHITPSFFFETVYYVDKSDVVADFFADEQTVNKIIESRREVAKSRWKFFQLDIAHSLNEIPEVDLVIALNGGDVLKNAFEKAKKEGYVLTSSEFSGEGFIKGDARFGHLLNIGFQSGEYRTLKEDRKKEKKVKAFTKDNVFRDTLEYSLYQRLH